MQLIMIPHKKLCELDVNCELEKIIFMGMLQIVLRKNFLFLEFFDYNLLTFYAFYVTLFWEYSAGKI